MKSVEFEYELEGKRYKVFVTKKSQKNTYYRFYDGAFHVTTSYFVTTQNIVHGLDKFAASLIKRSKAISSNYSFEEDYVYLLGEKYTLSSLNIFAEEDLNKFLKKTAKEVILELVRIAEKDMGISEPYKVSIKNMKTRLGSNSLQTRRLSFQLSLIHFSKEIINSVVIHELAHDFHRNHQKQFYNVVYKYCPNYDELTKKLKTGIHK